MGLEQHEDEEIIMRDLTSGCISPLKQEMMLTFKITSIQAYSKAALHVYLADMAIPEYIATGSVKSIFISIMKSVDKNDQIKNMSYFHPMFVFFMFMYMLAQLS